MKTKENVKNTEEVFLGKKRMYSEGYIDALKKDAEYQNRNIVPDLIELGVEISQEVLIELLPSNLSLIKKRLNKQIEENLKVIKDEHLIKSYLEVTKKKISTLYRKKRFVIMEEEGIRFLSVEDNQFVLTAENEKILRESYRYYYLTEPEEIQKHEQLKAVCDAFNAFGMLFSSFWDFVQLEDGKYISKDTLNYSEAVRRVRVNAGETTPEEVSEYEQVQAICDALNAFFVGKPFGYWFDYFELEDGKYIPRLTLNYSEVIKLIKLNAAEKQ